ncbi:hypothetical protein HDU67_003084 [Dinochytrium kinnereticum]|nr:hypothetical protein HDU67_003084 [Dinochytrium kinnereticum]
MNDIGVSDRLCLLEQEQESTGYSMQFSNIVTAYDDRLREIVVEAARPAYERNRVRRSTVAHLQVGKEGLGGEAGESSPGLRMGGHFSPVSSPRVRQRGFSVRIPAHSPPASLPVIGDVEMEALAPDVDEMEPVVESVDDVEASPPLAAAAEGESEGYVEFVDSKAMASTAEESTGAVVETYSITTVIEESTGAVAEEHNATTIAEDNSAVVVDLIKIPASTAMPEEITGAVVDYIKAQASIASAQELNGAVVEVVDHLASLTLPSLVTAKEDTGDMVDNPSILETDEQSDDTPPLTPLSDPITSPESITTSSRRRSLASSHPTSSRALSPPASGSAKAASYAARKASLMQKPKLPPSMSSRRPSIATRQ